MRHDLSGKGTELFLVFPKYNKVVGIPCIKIGLAGKPAIKCKQINVRKNGRDPGTLMNPDGLLRNLSARLIQDARAGILPDQVHHIFFPDVRRQNTLQLLPADAVKVLRDVRTQHILILPVPDLLFNIPDRCQCRTFALICIRVLRKTALIDLAKLHRNGLLHHFVSHGIQRDGSCLFSAIQHHLFDRKCLIGLFRQLQMQLL